MDERFGDCNITLTRRIITTSSAKHGPCIKLYVQDRRYKIVYLFIFEESNILIFILLHIFLDKLEQGEFWSKPGPYRAKVKQG